VSRKLANCLPVVVHEHQEIRFKDKDHLKMNIKWNIVIIGKKITTALPRSNVPEANICQENITVAFNIYDPS
jgi:hypothetical protein